MKDVYGNQRGKCNSCSCPEYFAPPDSDHYRCEYCNHTPNEHVKIVQLGRCNQCGPGECDMYESEVPNSYTDCQYCGCQAQHHEGAEACEYVCTYMNLPIGTIYRMGSMSNTISFRSPFLCRLRYYINKCMTVQNAPAIHLVLITMVVQVLCI